MTAIRDIYEDDLYCGQCNKGIPHWVTVMMDGAEYAECAKCGCTSVSDDGEPVDENDGCAV